MAEDNPQDNLSDRRLSSSVAGAVDLARRLVRGTENHSRARKFL